MSFKFYLFEYKKAPRVTRIFLLRLKTWLVFFLLSCILIKMPSSCYEFNMEERKTTVMKSETRITSVDFDLGQIKLETKPVIGQCPPKKYKDTTETSVFIFINFQH